MSFYLPWSRFPPVGGTPAPRSPRARLARWGLAGIATILLLGTGVYLWRKTSAGAAARATQRARESIAAGDYRSAQLTLEQNLQVNPRDFESMRLLADFYCRAGSARGLEIWADLVRLEPANAANPLGLAKAALQVRDYPQAERALASLGPDARQSLEYLRTEAALAFAAGDAARLTAGLHALEQAAPGDWRVRLNRAVVALHSRRSNEVAAAREVLLGFARGGPGRIRAGLELLRASPSGGSSGAVADLATAIIPPLANAARTGAFILTGIPAPGWPELFEHLGQEPDPSPEDALQLLQWMRANGLTRQAIVWVESLRPAIRNEPGVAQEAAVCAALLRDWRRLERLLAGGAWGAVPEDVLLLAFAARLQRDLGSRDRAIDTWRDALKATRDSVTALRVLARLADVFRWPEQAEATLWALVNRHPKEKGAWRALIAGAEAERSVGKLLEVFSAWSKLQPFDRKVAAERRLVVALLNRPEELPGDTAASLAEPGGEPAAALAARAVLLTRRGQAAEAAALLTPLTGPESDLPRVALARAYVHAEAGNLEPARAALAAAGRARFLPAEQVLLETARKHCEALQRQPRRKALIRPVDGG